MTTGMVEVRLAGLLAHHGSAPAGLAPDGVIRVLAGRSVLAVAAEIGIPPQQPLVAIVNGQTSDLCYTLRSGDHLTLIPPIAGG